MESVKLFFFAVALVCVAAKNGLAKSNELSHQTPNLLKSEIESRNGSGVMTYIDGVAVAVSVEKTHVINSFPFDKKEYVLLKDYNGNVVIIDAKSYEIISTYNLPEISTSIAVVVNDTFYNIDTINGVIMSTAVEEIMAPQNAVNWAQVGSFPPENGWISNSVAVYNSFIYFVSYHGVLYLFDPALKTVTKMGDVIDGEFYASLVVVNNILYIHKFSHFYSFDGAVVKEIVTPDERHNPGLFQFGNFICRVGGNITDIGSNQDPVFCYDPNDETWTVSSYINQYRQFPGITSTESGSCVFGGWAYHALGPDNWLNLAEVFDPNTKIWS